jgi:hypothetical protein
MRLVLAEQLQEEQQSPLEPEVRCSLQEQMVLVRLEKRI